MIFHENKITSFTCNKTFKGYNMAKKLSKGFKPILKLNKYNFLWLVNFETI
jgi:hypothetical protein